MCSRGQRIVWTRIIKCDLVTPALEIAHLQKSTMVSEFCPINLVFTFVNVDVAPFVPECSRNRIFDGVRVTT